MYNILPAYINVYECDYTIKLFESVFVHLVTDYGPLSLLSINVALILSSLMTPYYSIA